MFGENQEAVTAMGRVCVLTPLWALCASSMDSMIKGSVASIWASDRTDCADQVSSVSKQSVLPQVALCEWLSSL